MKTINVFYLHNNQNSIIDLKPLIDSCLKDSGNFKNSSLDFIEQKNHNTCICRFKTKYSDSYNVEIVFLQLNLNANLDNVSNFLKFVVSESITNAENISVEPIDKSKKEEIFLKIQAKFNNYYSYRDDFLTPNLISYDDSYYSIIDLVNEIFCEILVSHLLINGNKRLATMLLTNFLYSFGYYLKYTKSSFQNWNKISKDIANFVSFYEKENYEKRFISLCKKTKKFILNNIVLALNFQKI